MDTIHVQRILRSHQLELSDLKLFCSEVIFLGVQEEAWTLCCIAYDDSFGFSNLDCQSREAPEGIWYRFSSGLLNILVQRRYTQERFFQSDVGRRAYATGQWLHRLPSS